VILFRIPAIIATLASGYMLATLTLLANRQVKTGRTAETLVFLAAGRIGGVPVVALIALASSSPSRSCSVASPTVATSPLPARAGPRPPSRACASARPSPSPSWRAAS
jgi:hypothetical protein